MQSSNMIKWICCVYLACLASATAQQNPPYTAIANAQRLPKNGDGSVSANIGLGGKDYSSECSHTFTITPNPVLTEQDLVSSVTFNVGALGGPTVTDTGSLVPATIATNAAFNIHSGGYVQWVLNGPQVPFASGIKAGCHIHDCRAKAKWCRLPTLRLGAT
jgi:hypothetical protein